MFNNITFFIHPYTMKLLNPIVIETNSVFTNGLHEITKVLVFFICLYIVPILIKTIIMKVLVTFCYQSEEIKLIKIKKKAFPHTMG